MKLNNFNTILSLLVFSMHDNIHNLYFTQLQKMNIPNKYLAGIQKEWMEMCFA